MRDDLKSRRTLIAGVGAGGLTLALTACGAGGEQVSSAATGSGTPASSAPAAQDAPAAGLGAAGDVPVGGGKIFKEQKVVVTQPKAGEFKAFSAICTHQGCAVGSVADGTINCPCHNSKFSIADGSPVAGPAKQPLPEKQITVDGGQVKLA
ncbi:Rieske (2Fe-2S) protein [Nonomuraea typhae]|uniref:Cytochrome bc1 complex Rieske iron-sulfur subunit n=1 Tax=Nonomuraea typhae TaxID=2603600 RepID=A0ABW7Z7B8_9ACTN